MIQLLWEDGSTFRIIENRSWPVLIPGNVLEFDSVVTVEVLHCRYICDFEDGSVANTVVTVKEILSPEAQRAAERSAFKGEVIVSLVGWLLGREQDIAFDIEDFGGLQEAFKYFLERPAQKDKNRGSR